MYLNLLRILEYDSVTYLLDNDCKPRTTICVQTYQSPVSTKANGTEQNRHIEHHGAKTTELPPLAQGGAGTNRDPFA